MEAAECGFPKNPGQRFHCPFAGFNLIQLIMNSVHIFLLLRIGTCRQTAGPATNENGIYFKSSPGIASRDFILICL